MTPIPDEEFERVKERTEIRHIINRDRTTSSTSYAITRIGHELIFWATSGLLDTNETKSVPITLNRELSGESTFERIPFISIYELKSDTSPIIRSTGPSSPSKDFIIRPLSAATWELKWVGADERWEVIITNSDTVKRDFVIIVRGV